MSLDVALTIRRGRDFRLDVAFVAPSPGVTALTGPSGVGKTSVLRAVTGLDRYPGKVSLDGVIWQDARHFAAPHRRRIGYVAQGPSLLPHLTVAANLAYAARRAGPGPFAHDDVIARTGIAALLERRPADLSGGEAQRAAIARALLGQPRLLLMDEPLSALDGAGRQGLLDALEGLFAAAALPVLYVTHDGAEAARLATAMVRLA